VKGHAKASGAGQQAGITMQRHFWFIGKCVISTESEWIPAAFTALANLASHDGRAVFSAFAVNYAPAACR